VKEARLGPEKRPTEEPKTVFKTVAFVRSAILPERDYPTLLTYLRWESRSRQGRGQEGRSSWVDTLPEVDRDTPQDQFHSAPNVARPIVDLRMDVHPV